MKVNTRCPKCHTEFAALAETLGLRVRCLRCSDIFVVEGEVNLNQSTDPITHEAARRLATRFVEIVRGVLTEAEAQAALTAAYTVARQELERTPCSRS